MHASHTDGKSRTKADSRQWENPKTWPILHQGIAGPIQSGSPPPPPPQLPALTSCGYTPSLPPPPPSVSWSSVEQPPFALSLSLSCSAPPCLPHTTILPPPLPPPPRPPPLTSSRIVMTAAGATHTTAEGEKHECVPASV